MMQMNGRPRRTDLHEADTFHVRHPREQRVAQRWRTRGLTSYRPTGGSSSHRRSGCARTWTGRNREGVSRHASEWRSALREHRARSDVTGRTATPAIERSRTSPRLATYNDMIYDRAQICRPDARRARTITVVEFLQTIRRAGD